MTEERFWEIVESFRWEYAGYDYDARTVELLRTMSFNDLKELQDKYYEKMEELAGIEHRTGREIREVSDDGWMDLRAHVIGCGREEYERTLNDFNRLQERASTRDYRECFSYVIPNPEDVALLTMRYWSILARQYEEELRQVLRSDLYSDEVKATVGRIIDALRRIGPYTSKEHVQESVNYIKSLPDETWKAPWNPSSHGVPNLAKSVERYILN